LKHLATEVMSLLQKETGTTEYISVYQSVHEQVQNARRDRKAQRAIRAVSNPKAHAIEKQKKTLAKINARKRKANEFASKKLKQGHSSKLKLH
jgi:U3 small nucleolar RNA-associated protein 20